MRIKRFGISLMTLILSFSLLSVSAYGIDSFRDNVDYIQQVSSRDEELVVLLAGSELPDEAPSAEQFSVMLGTAQMEVASVQSVEQEPITYYCLADVSDSMQKSQIKLERRVMQELCDSLRDGDQMVIAKLGDSVEEGAYMTDPADISKAISEVDVSATTTNLYSGITYALNSLSTSNRATTRKCLVVLSDGEDYKKDGGTRTEMERAISRSRIPVCTVALMNQDTVESKKWQKYAKQLGSFARLSVGGISSNPVLSGNKSGKKVGKTIASARARDLCLLLSVPQDSPLSPESNAMALTVRYTTADGSTLDDAIDVYPQDLGTLWTQQKPDGPDPGPNGESSAQSGAESGSALPTDEDESFWQKNRTWIIVGGSIAVALILVLIAVLVAARRKKRRELEKTLIRQREEEERRRLAAEEAERRRLEAEEEQRRLEQERLEAERIKIEVGPFPPPLKSDAKPAVGRMVRFDIIGGKAWSKEVGLIRGKEYVFGRDKRADVALFPMDNRLSGRHFGLVCDESGIYLWDAGSRNGTSVDGVPLEPGKRIQIQDNVIVKAGNCDYRIRFSKGWMEWNKSGET